METVLLLLSLSTDHDFFTVDPLYLSSVKFSYFLGSRGDECHILCPFKLALNV